MTTFIPALLAVLLAEFGGRTAQFAQLPRLMLAATLLGLAVGVAAFAGYEIAPTLNPQARSLMLGLALILTGANQFGRPIKGDPPATLFATVIYVWRSGAPFLAFAFSIWRSAPVGAAAGALCGIVAVVALSLVPIPDQVLKWIRRLAGGTMIAIGVYAALWAFRLVA